MTDRPDTVDCQTLAAYAQTTEYSRGRRHGEDEHPYRSLYQRDRDRIIHSRAFRRLEYKTQVFVNHEGDHYRTRLTHSIEVAQIGRTVARALSVNEDLVESLALSHDLGHAPFGHLGEEVLSELLADSGGFNHNRQTLRIVEHLEQRYPNFRGLNLSWETREGIAKHSGPIDITFAPEFAEYEPDLQGPIEAQMIDLVDEIAYNHHDVDDGLESGLLDLNELADNVAMFGEPLERAKARPDSNQRQIRIEALSAMIETLVSDLIETSRKNIAEAGVSSVGEVRSLGRSLIGLSPEVAEQNRGLKRHLHRNLYEHPQIERMKDKARRLLQALFERYTANPRLLPGENRRTAEKEQSARAIADYMAGMTDRFAIQEYQRLFDPAVRS